MRGDFNNFMAKSIEKHLMEGPKLPDVTNAKFFKINIKFHFLIGCYLIKTEMICQKICMLIKICSRSFSDGSKKQISITYRYFHVRF